jgi:hypothetical protein
MKKLWTVIAIFVIVLVIVGVIQGIRFIANPPIVNESQANQVRQTLLQNGYTVKNATSGDIGLSGGFANVNIAFIGSTPCLAPKLVNLGGFIGNMTTSNKVVYRFNFYSDPVDHFIEFAQLQANGICLRSYP